MTQPSRLDTLARDVDDVAAVGAVKRLQIVFSQYAEVGLWQEMADLFAADGEAVFGAHIVRGRDAIHHHFRTEYGGGEDGLPAGGVRFQLPLAPVVTLGADEHTAKARWHELAMLGQVGGDASWAGGIYENDYVLEDGAWRIARLHYHPQFAGPYEGGWRNVEPDLKVVPYHYTPETAGIPIPSRVAPATPRASTTLPALDRRLNRMEDERAVQNLQNAYGYYVDRKMWDDVADLFADDGIFTVAGLGSWIGPGRIRRGLDRDGPAGLRAGELNEHVQVAMVVTISPDGSEACARGLDLGMLGTNTAKAYWSVATFENRYVRHDGIWRIAEVRLFHRLKSDYALGWGKSVIVDPPLPAAFAPDRPAPTAAGAIPAFSYPHPVTGRMPLYPADAVLVPTGPDWIAASTADSSTADFDAVEVKCRRLAAYDGVENISSAFGNYIDDFAWTDLGQLFASKGAREMPYVGFFIGPDRITRAAVTKWGAPRSPRGAIPIHLRMQPVIDVSDDGRSARYRMRLFQIFSTHERPGTFSGGTYPNEQAVLENGVWKLWSVAIDEWYYNSANYADGWVNVPTEPAERKPDMLLAAFPPDIPLTALGEREQGFIPGSTELNPYVFNGPAYPGYPSATPMWFSYRNPVSGRMPKYYWPDCATCVARPDTSLSANGY